MKSIATALAIIIGKHYLLGSDPFQIDDLGDFLSDWGAMLTPLGNEVKTLLNRRGRRNEPTEDQEPGTADATDDEADTTVGQSSPPAPPNVESVDTGGQGNPPGPGDTPPL
ncbi:hypothetical protein Snoj_32310 [Streptomyces nojiriensis]|uniref:Uncharacterized protein n=1 Tax=Streptomyces nojiriensis TaxID=66374 RepID=A0ABQ3SMG5_9ACTN|nr:hypothetical protein [Streptomyces nojiriensis]QTI42886.1 hypothetical protein JYK04_00647 [Streptomyces nojiriensis]GGS40952.1 hypothetical protein GCM10010205_82520 [Streptomyces nojiriensis]GHI69313.1 hypothetical protein Snoj_32310 [Streptomyces nojiriensis]